ncbi:MAG: DUF1570 domain-containing protein [Planctomycetaceae bacterium]
MEGCLTMLQNSVQQPIPACVVWARRFPRTVVQAMVLFAALLPAAGGGVCGMSPSDQLTIVTAETQAGPVELTGRLLAEGASGWLLEDQAGRLTQIPADAIRGSRQLDSQWKAMGREELGVVLTESAGANFLVTATDHFLICSDCSDDYNEFCGRLLEKVYAEFYELMQELEISVSEPAGLLPVLIFSSAARFQSHAAAIHPEVDFSDTPGFYTVRDNQVLLRDLTRDSSLKGQAAIRGMLAKQPLQVATMVHETVHQLAFNSGLQVRFADNPVWFSEGLALYFEQTSVRSTLLWIRPGLVNARHHPTFKARTQGGTLPISLQDLCALDGLFSSGETAGIAYAESWAVMSYLIRRQPQSFATYVKSTQQLRPLQVRTAEERVQQLMEALSVSDEEFSRKLIQMISRLRVSR